MVRRLLLLGGTLATLCAATAAASTGTPVFAAFPAGWPPGMKLAANSKGFGQVKPSTISVGPGGICHIDWISWGGRLAIGAGIGLQVNPVTYKNYPARVVIVLGDLGTWHGRPAYTRYEVSAPPGGHPASAHPHTGLQRCSVQKQAVSHSR